MTDPLLKVENLIHNLLQCLKVLDAVIERVEAVLRDTEPNTDDEDFIDDEE